VLVFHQKLKQFVMSVHHRATCAHSPLSHLTGVLTGGVLYAVHDPLIVVVLSLARERDLLVVLRSMLLP
jgi:hypothetical protein